VPILKRDSNTEQVHQRNTNILLTKRSMSFVDLQDIDTFRLSPLVRTSKVTEIISASGVDPQELDTELSAQTGCMRSRTHRPRTTACLVGIAPLEPRSRTSIPLESASRLNLLLSDSRVSRKLSLSLTRLGIPESNLKLFPV
jgi:hypothetical protein